MAGPPAPQTRQPGPARRLGAGRLLGILGLTLLGVLAFLLLLDVAYNQGDAVAPWYTDRMDEDVASSVLVAVMVLALVADVALLLPARRNEAPWAPGASCTSCGAWVDEPGRACPSCGAPPMA